VIEESFKTMVGCFTEYNPDHSRIYKDESFYILPRNSLQNYRTSVYVCNKEPLKNLTWGVMQ